ncbi:MAG: DUF11 domain-containing protein [Acaryochloridaceae cyanobacterium RU_4_10]|nr:DUF11 domain-containing protein [Acaryochloridaceae cyanobacterium RU_4_10]
MVINDTNNKAINTPPPTTLNLWNNNYQSSLANASSGQSISLTPNGIDSNASACWESTTSGLASGRCPNYLPTRDIDPLRTTSMGDNNNGGPNLRLAKRITAISGASLVKYIDVNVVPVPANASDDNAPYWTKTGAGVTAIQYPTAGTTTGFSDYLKGIVDSANLLSSDPPRPKPNQEVEYTIYFLSDGLSSAKNVSICDYIPENTTFVPGSLQLSIGSAAPTLKTDTIGDTDGAGYYASGFPSSCQSSAGHSKGAVVVNINQVDYATGPGNPLSSYGFIRFRTRID